MKLLLVQNRNYADFSDQYSFENVIEFLEKPKEDSDIIQNIEFDEISSYIENLEGEIDGIVMSNWLVGRNESKSNLFHSAFELATYLRLSKSDIKYLPILILSKLSTEEILRFSISEPHILRASSGTKIVDPSTVIWEYKSDNDDDIPENSSDFDNHLGILFKTTFEQIKKDYLKQIRSKILVIDNSTSGHDVANQWGAYRMAQVASVDISKYKFPKNLYFRYLLSRDNLPSTFNLKECDPFYEKDLKILFIDDKFDSEWKGALSWEQTLTYVFNNTVIKTGKTVFTSHKHWIDVDKSRIELDKYDLILLDYYLSNNEKGIDILRVIKKSNRAVPVIIFTASNKAWNMDDLYEAGADGYYVKEHPETANNAEFSIKNFENFHRTVKKCLEKGTLLRKYWRKIKEIENSIFISDNIGQKNKERINERLVMFVGLLKKAFEQTTFDKDAFFYSEWELAFLTLWSTLNEIQEVHYEKNNNFVEFSFTDNQGIVRKKVRHPRGSRFIPNHLTNWKIKNSNEYLIAYRPAFDLNGQPKLKNDQYYDLIKYSTIFRDSSKLSGIRLEMEYSLLSDERWRYEKNLSIQISFLIYNFSPTETLDRDNLIYNLLSLNDNIRNKLYLTHGEDSSSPNFALEYKDQRLSDIDWQKHIEQLFEIVYFLCTGKECDWNN